MEEELKEALGPEAARKIAELLGKFYKELTNTVTKKERVCKNYNDVHILAIGLAAKRGFSL